MTILDILGRDVRIEWHEAVAILRDVAEQVSRSAEPAAVPELHQIELLPHGDLALHGGAEVRDPAERLAQVLQTLLSRADPPVQLRLAISQAHESVEGLAEALGFFERPDRAAVLQSLYARSVVALPLDGAETFTGIFSDSADPTPGMSGPEESLPRRRTYLYAAGLLVVILAVGAVALYATRAESASNDGSDIRSRVSSGVSTVTTAVGSAVSAIGESVGLGTLPAAALVEAPTAPPPAVATANSKRSPKAPVKGAAPELERATLTAFDLSSSPLASLVPRETVVVVAQPEGTSPGRSVDAGEPVVYSSASQDVSAPVGVRPQLPKEMPPGIRAEDLTRIELVILPDGSVESVRLLDRPRDIHASMLLSAAKAWEFRPAMRNGVAVKYRKTVWVAR